MKNKFSKIELFSCISLAVFVVAWIIYGLCYNPGYTLTDIGLGFRHGFIDYFKASSSKVIFGIICLLVLLTFSSYWCVYVIRNKFLTFGPIYLILLFASVLFMNGYYNVVYQIDGLILIEICLIINLFFNTVCSYYLYIINKERKKKEE